MGWCGAGKQGRGEKGGQGEWEEGRRFFFFLRDRDLELHSRAHGSRH